MKYLHFRQFSCLFQENWSVLLKWCCRESYFNIYTISYGSVIYKSNRELLFTSVSFSALQLALWTGICKGRLCHFVSELIWKSDPRDSNAGFEHPKIPLALLWEKSWNTLLYKLIFKASVGRGERKGRPQHFSLCFRSWVNTEILRPMFYMLTMVSNVERDNGYSAFLNSSPGVIFWKSSC